MEVGKLVAVIGDEVSDMKYFRFPLRQRYLRSGGMASDRVVGMVEGFCVALAGKLTKQLWMPVRIDLYLFRFGTTLQTLN